MYQLLIIAYHFTFHHFARSCAACSQDSGGMVKFLREAFRVSLWRFFWSTWELFATLSSP